MEPPAHGQDGTRIDSAGGIVTGLAAPATGGPEDNPAVTFETLWSAALYRFQQRTDIQPGHWRYLLDRMEPCKSAEDVCAIFDEDMQALVRFRAADSTWGRLRKEYLKPAVEVLLLFNDALAEVASSFPAVPGGKAILVAFGVLLVATKGITAYFEALMGLFEEIQLFLEGLRVRLEVPASLGSASQNIAITILAHLLDVCVCATKLLSKRPWLGRLAIYWKTLTKNDDVRKSLERMRQLAAMESHAIMIETRIEVSNIQAVASDAQETTAQNYVQANELLRDQAAAASKSRSLIGRGVAKILKGQKDIMGLIRAERMEYLNIFDATRVIEKLSPVIRADIDAQDSEGCMKGTRVRILKTLRAWSRDSNAPQIFWLNGMAGTGKSAIARSFCHTLRRDGLLGGSFFCSRGGSVEEGNVQRIIPTLTASMAKGNTAFNKALLILLQKEPFSIQWNVELQIERLLSGPLGSLQPQNTDDLPIFVIDALDECADEHATRDLLVRLVKLSGSLPAKFFLTSRPEPHLRGQLESMDAAIGKVLRLHDIEEDIVRADISLYLTNELRGMRQMSFPPKWPTKADITILTRLSGKLFIYAFTVLQYLRRDPVSRLKKLTETTFIAGRPITKPLDDIYNLILSEAMNPDEYDTDEIEMTQAIIANIVTMREPLSMTSLSELLNMPVHRIKGSLDRLYAVIYVPERDDSGGLSTFHASFGDFVTNPGRAPRYMNDRVLRSHRELALTCLRTLQSDQLCFNVAQVVTSHLPNAEQELVRIADPLRYACLHWGHHIAIGNSFELLMSLEQVFMGPKFLFWLEVMSVLGLSEKAVDILAAAQAIRDMHNGLIEFLNDATAFINDFSLVIAQSTPHIYLSALACCHPESLIARHCWPYFSHLAIPTHQTHDNGHFIRPAYVTYSPDGNRIVAGMFDGSIHYYSAQTGETVMPPHRVHTRTVLSIGFSRDGNRIASASQDKSFALWNSHTEQHTVYRYALERSDWIRSVTVSPDGRLLASGTPEYLVHIHRVETGHLMGQLEGHSGQIRAIEFSPDGYRIASGSMDHSVCVWQINTGRLLFPPLFGHTEMVLSVAFPPMGPESCLEQLMQRSASGTPFPAITLGALATTTAKQSDGATVASGSDDGTICVWDAETGKLAMEPLKASTIHSINFSPDGRRLVSASYDRIYVWDVRPALSGKVQSGLDKHILRTDTEGWLRTPIGELLLWAGKGNHKVRNLPRCALIIGYRGGTIVGSIGVQGTQWERCYTPPADMPRFKL